MVHVDLMVPYSKSRRKQQPSGTVIRKNSSLTCMTMIDPDTGWFDIIEITPFYIEDVTLGNDEYIDKSSYRVPQLLNNTWLCRYPRPRKVVFEKVSELQRDFTPLLKDFDIKSVLTSVNKPQANAPVEQVHQVILNMLFTKDLYNKVFNYIYPWGETIAYIAWSIRAFYHCTIMATPVQAVFVRDMIFNLASVVDWQFATTAKQRQVDTDYIR